MGHLDIAPTNEPVRESERRIYPAAHYNNMRLPTEVGVPGAVSKCAALCVVSALWLCRRTTFR
jgi:hypothetical protein